ncbi:GNAT family N-acetyltransferase [Nonomuraea sp. NPDC050663]|uniref:GNAT family N-acetyltransferase n=1 Tax=Nonomuraea sp. NPDC050663 TaxID=3364370 RepID=UPI0037878593
MNETAELTISELTEVADHHRAAELITRIWGSMLLEPGLIRTISHVGGYVAGAHAQGELVGIAVGFFAGDGHLHSHITGVLPGARGGTGYALKQHQRSWCRERGVPYISWTFDPLVSRNAYLNVHRLGARIAAYLPDFYGTMSDSINAGDASDRLYVVWEVERPRDPSGAADAAVLLGRDGLDPVRLGVLPGEHERLAVAMPKDVEGLRLRAPNSARRWRAAVREALMTAADAGHEIVDVTRDGWYVLNREQQRE